MPSLRSGITSGLGLCIRPYRYASQLVRRYHPPLEVAPGQRKTHVNSYRRQTVHQGKVYPEVTELPRGNELSRDHVNRPLETSLKVTTIIISFHKCKSVRRCQKLVSTKTNRTDSNLLLLKISIVFDILRKN